MFKRTGSIAGCHYHGAGQGVSPAKKQNADIEFRVVCRIIKRRTDKPHAACKGKFFLY